MTDDAKCRGCGAKIQYMLSPAGKRMPVQPVRSVYARRVELFGTDDERLERVEGFASDGLFVSHFETCPYADDFSGSKR